MSLSCAYVVRYAKLFASAASAEARSATARANTLNSINTTKKNSINCLDYILITYRPARDRQPFDFPRCAPSRTRPPPLPRAANSHLFCGKGEMAVGFWQVPALVHACSITRVADIDIQVSCDASLPWLTK
jgi:hypothetical protein